MAEKSRSLTDKEFNEGVLLVTAIRQAVRDGLIMLARLEERDKAIAHSAPDTQTATVVTLEAEEEVQFIEMCVQSLNERASKLRKEYGCRVNFTVVSGKVLMRIFENKILSDDTRGRI